MYYIQILAALGLEVQDSLPDEAEDIVISVNIEEVPAPDGSLVKVLDRSRAEQRARAMAVAGGYVLAN